MPYGPCAECDYCRMYEEQADIAIRKYKIEKCYPDQNDPNDPHLRCYLNPYVKKKGKDLVVSFPLLNADEVANGLVGCGHFMRAKECDDYL